MGGGTAEDPADPLGLRARSHPLRAGLSQEMHLRRLAEIAAPAQLLQIMLLVEDPAADEAGLALIAELCGTSAALPAGARHALFQIGGARGVWERHSEFLTFTFIHEGLPVDPFDQARFAPIRPLIGRMPGAVIRATLVVIAPAGDEPRMERLAREHFVADELVKCDVLDGRARLSSSFRLDPDGVGRLLIVDRGLEGEEAMQLVQRVQELGNYRNMALLGLPLARRLTPDLARLEQRLAALTADVATPGLEDAPLLDGLTALSATLARMLADSRYRMSATQAYAKIVEERLEWLQVRAIGGHQTLADFTDRRLMPAVRTCATVTKRMEELAQNAARASALLRTRVDTALARQNRDLLRSMDRRTDLQLRLQQAVEGLSVVAISYYLVALIGELIHPLTHERHDWFVAAAVPIVMLLVFLQLTRFRRRLHH